MRNLNLKRINALATSAAAAASAPPINRPSAMLRNNNRLVSNI